MKLGSAILGVINFHKQIDWMRLNTIHAKWGEKVDYEIKDGKTKDKYRRITVDTPEDDKYDQEIIEFNPDKARNISSREIFEAQKKLKNTKLTFIDPEKFRNLKTIFQIVEVPKQNDSSELEKVMLIENATALANFGITPNPTALAKTYCNMAKLPFEELYGNAITRPQNQPTPRTDQMKQDKQQTPSINTIANA